MRKAAWDCHNCFAHPSSAHLSISLTTGCPGTQQHNFYWWIIINWYDGRLWKPLTWKSCRSCLVAVGWTGFAQFFAQCVSHPFTSLQGSWLMWHCGWMIKCLESFCGVFAYLVKASPTIFRLYICGPPDTCALTIFMIPTICTGYFGAMDALSGWSLGC